MRKNNREEMDERKKKEITEKEMDSSVELDRSGEQLDSVSFEEHSLMSDGVSPRINVTKL